MQHKTTLTRFKTALLTLCFLVACEPSKTDQNHPTSSEEPTGELSNLGIFHTAENDSLYQLVVYKHDESMLIHDNDMPALKRNLKQRYEDETKKEIKDDIMKCLRGFNKASEDMFAWMREFKGVDLYDEDYQVMTAQEVQTYLESEEDKIELVALQIENAIVKGDSLLNTLTK